MSLSQIQIGTGDTVVLLASGNIGSLTIFFCNTDTNARLLNVYLIKSGGGSAATTNQIISAYSIDPLDTFTLDWERLALDDGDKIVAKCDVASKVTSTASYIQL